MNGRSVPGSVSIGGDPGLRTLPRRDGKRARVGRDEEPWLVSSRGALLRSGVCFEGREGGEVV